MIEDKPFLAFLTHLFLICGFLVAALPIYVAVIASTHYVSTLMVSGFPCYRGIILSKITE
ncbi:hypothetical protein MUU53_08845 [Rhizobium lemnae]|uniref:Uncharacterized protein n=1 Tax=Rhizobium lemnae TaxID=1214924 RepID=A0ABV8E582_9HYPH|nr:hypothetical protein [Rhizobium lemnae]MCJ8508022.1 hypothetical protein [Rhizobium lemnae]